MRGLYRVIIVDPELEEVVFDSDMDIPPIFAKSEESAKFQGFRLAGTNIVKDPEDYDVGVILLVKMRKKKEIQEVKLVKD